MWTALAVAAYALPATLGAAVLARFVRRYPDTAAVDARLSVIAKTSRVGANL